jgi:hypothetical protein
MSIQLKIKSKHLSEEARIIRFEENRLLKQVSFHRTKHKESGHNSSFSTWDCPEFKTFYSIRNHRTHDVRNENRATFLARAFLEGKPYSYIEQKRKPEKEFNFKYFVLPRVLTMVNKYGNVQVTKEQLVEWCKLE